MLDELRAGVNFTGGTRSKWVTKDRRTVHLDVSIVPVAPACAEVLKKRPCTQML